MKNEEIIIKRLTIKDNPNVYWIGRKATRLTFLSQQQRALNLIWALHNTGSLPPGSEVTVVGAGLAGLTAAFAASQLGAKVRLLESKSVPLHLQRGCQLRFVHPYILDWPDQTSEIPITNLPCLNWGADMAAQISNTVLEQWEEMKKDVQTYYGYEVRQIGRSTDGRPHVIAEGRLNNEIHTCDHLILAIGFGLERSLSNVPFLSYWENDNFGRPVITGPIPRRYLVSGCGDGGLIDAIRLRINAFDHAEFVYHLSRIHDLVGVKQRLLEIEKEVIDQLKARDQNQINRRLREMKNNGGRVFDPINAKRRIEEDDAGKLLEGKYRSLLIPEALKTLLTKQLREDTIVYLNSPSLSPLNLQASVLNRFIVFLLREYGGLRYRAGEVELLPTTVGQPFRVLFRHQEFLTEELEVHEVIVRHGPIPAIARLFPKTITEDCRAGADEYEDPTRQPLYPPDFLNERRLIAQKRKVQLGYAIAISPLAAKERFNPSVYDRFSIEVTNDQEQPKYVLRPRRVEDLSNTQLPSPFNGIVFGFDLPLNPVPSLPGPIQSQDQTLSLGIGIQNIGSPNSVESKGRGTLGCFVRLKATGEQAFLTSVFSLGGPGTIQVGDNITRVSETGSSIGNIIATIKSMHLPIPSSPRSSFAAGNRQSNEFEAVLAVLMPGSLPQIGFGSSYPDLPALNSFDDKNQPLLGTRVFKVGMGSGLTRGQIDTVEVMSIIQGDGEQYWYEGLFGIVGDNDKPFAQPGDNGAVVVRDDGVILGMIIGGSNIETLACPIQPILAALDCELI